MLGLELPDLQLDDDIAAQHELVEQQVNEEVLAADLQVPLASHDGEALSHLQQESLHVCHQATLDLPLAGLLVKPEKPEQVWVLTETVIRSAVARGGRYADAMPGRERLLAGDVGPSAYLVVVVEIHADAGTVVTAYAMRRMPDAWRRL